MSNSKFYNPEKSESWPWYARYKEYDNTPWEKILEEGFKRKMYEDIIYINNQLDNILD